MDDSLVESVGGPKSLNKERNISSFISKGLSDQSDFQGSIVGRTIMSRARSPSERRAREDALKLYGVKMNGIFIRHLGIMNDVADKVTYREKKAKGGLRLKY